MNSTAPWLRVAAVSTIVLFATAGVLSNSPSLVTPAKPASCEADEYHQFDFWIGDWDAFDADKPNEAVARTRVDRILGACVLREDYQQNDGMKGESFNIYDKSRNVWHQSWVTTRGQLLILEGQLQAGAMVLNAVDHADGKETMIQGTWKSDDGGVRETAVKSGDGGKTWTPWFDIIFRPHRNNTSIIDDRKTVADLDNQYQAAVKNNDVATMDRILADDFVLVTGSGKSYTKANLIDDARQSREVYEHQEDTEQTVRVYDDTAVVTAKLWEKGTRDGEPFDYTVWFSDTYVRTPSGWRYAFGQSSLPLPKSL